MSDQDKLAQIAYREHRPALRNFVRARMRKKAGYSSLADAAAVTGDDRYAGSGVEIWYMKPQYFRDLIMGPEFVQEQYPDLMPQSERDLSKTHVKLGEISASTPGDVFEMMQGMNWSPRGEANDLIRKKGLKHTSMSVGDVIVIRGKVYMVDNLGFEKIARQRSSTRVPHDAARQWNQGNNRGEGFAVGNSSDDINDLEGIDGLRQLLKPAETTSDVAVYLDQSGELVAVGDANGPWAVFI